MRAGMLGDAAALRRFAPRGARTPSVLAKRLRRLVLLASQRPLAPAVAAATLVALLFAIRTLGAPATPALDRTLLQYPSSDRPVPQRSVSVVVPDPGVVPASRLEALLRSLQAAEYPENGGVDLFVFIKGSAYARHVGGTPENALREAASRLSWTHGSSQVLLYGREEEWMAIIGRTAMTSALVFPDVSYDISPAYFDFFEKAMKASHGSTDTPQISGSPVLACGLDALAPTRNSSAPHPWFSAPGDSVTVARSNMFLPVSTAFAPTREAWDLFLAWYRLQSKSSHPGSVLPLEFSLFRGRVVHEQDVRRWFALFAHMYGGHTLYPVSLDGKSLVERSGIGLPLHEDPSRISFVSGVKSLTGSAVELFSARAWPHSIRPVVPFAALIGKEPAVRYVPYDASSIRMPESFSSVLRKQNTALRGEVLADRARSDAVERVAQFANRRGGRIAFTLVTDAFLETTYSWICNVLAVNALPKALVFGASDSKVVAQLESFFVNDSRVSEHDVLVVDLSSSLQAVQKARKPEAGLDFGSTEYWLLMLERTALLRDVLDAGVSILHFETDQIWFGDPMPDINALLERPVAGSVGGHGSGADMALTINTRGEASGNFFFLRPSLRTRHLWGMITTAFQASYLKSLKTKEAQNGRWHYIDNDQSLFTRYGLGKDWWYRSSFPVASYEVLDKQRFVDGTWYLDFEDENGNKVSRRKYYTSEESKSPLILNNNFMIGVQGKKHRAQRFGHWFWDEAAHGCNATMGTGQGQVPVVAIQGLAAH